MSLTENYFRLHKEFEKKYGDRICLLIQVGKFYEAYQYNPDKEGQLLREDSNLTLKQNLEDSVGSIGIAVKLSLIVNMKITSKNKELPHSIGNPIMMGFPTPAYETHREVILNNGYTIIRIDQKGKGESVERGVAEVSSPGTELNFNKSTNVIVSIYLECQKGKGAPKNQSKMVMITGLSSIDICTGQSSVSEIYSKDQDESYALLEIYRFLEAQNPVEILLHVNKIPQEQVTSYERFLHDQLELDRYPIRVVQSNQLDPTYFRDVYQESMLYKAFGSGYQLGSTNLVFELGLELFRYGLISFVVLLQYCYEHNEKIIDRLQKPKVGFTDDIKQLILTHNAARQLDLVSEHTTKKKEINSLFSVLNLTSTEIGSRYLRQQLLNPIIDSEELEVRYMMTQELLDSSEFAGQIDMILKGIPDLERLQRKAQIGLLRPKELVTLINGYVSVNQLYNHLYHHPSKALSTLLLKQEAIKEFNEMMAHLLTRIDMEKLERAKVVKGNIQTNESFFLPGKDPEVDQLQNGLTHAQSWLTVICDHFNDIVGSARGKKIEPTYERAKITDNEEEVDQGDITIVLYTTPTKANQLKRSPSVNQQLCGVLEFQEMRAKSKTMITSDVIRQVIYAIESYQKVLEQNLTLKYNQLVTILGASKFFVSVALLLAKLDFALTSAKLAIKYNYFRPTINKEAKGSFIKITGMRHPLIERLIRTEYIPNDLELVESGLMIFGVNSTGKTSLAKALPCILIMAQAGLYVPGKLCYRPITRIITRLSGEDKMLEGKSSFIVEMSEANTILRNADGNTLVVGDELCRGTETLSGVSLTVSMVKTLVERKTPFIFSTHMHILPEIDMIQELTGKGRVQIKHLSTEYDPKSDQLVYNRKLLDGSGSSLYGLEVCKSLGMDQSFLEYANKVRRELEGIPEKLVSTKKCRYSGLPKTNCFNCGATISVQSHHIREQSKADDRGFIDHVQKDSGYNIIFLCVQCHSKIHKEKITITQQQTLHGVQIGVS